jgi:hypothetical protein
MSTQPQTDPDPSTQSEAADEQRADTEVAANAIPGASAEERPAAPAPLLQLLRLPGLSAPTGNAPVCGPDGCAVPPPAE